MSNSSLRSAPRISVVIPVFNAQRYLREAIDSILNQTYQDFEVLLYDDGSSDKSPDILRAYAAQDDRIHPFFHGHRGLVPWLNEGIKAARGEFIARMDADDISMPTRFETQVKYLDENPACTGIGSRVLWIDEEGDPLSESNPPLSHEEIDRAHLALRVSGSRICHPTLMIRREAMVAVDGYRDNHNHAEDLDIFLRLQRPEVGLDNLPDVLLHYRMHSKCIGYEKGRAQLDGVYSAVEDAYQRRGIPIPAELKDSVLSNQPLQDTIQWYIRVATNNGHWRTARKHALHLLRQRPWSPRAWRLALRMSLGWFPNETI